MRATLTLICFWLAAFAAPAFAAETVPVDTGEVEGQLVTSHDVAAPGQEIYVAVSTVLNEGWHTYWRNPGDSGEPFDVRFDDHDLISFGDVIWPLPAPIPTGPIINYGFEGAPLFLVPARISPDAQPGDVITLTGMSYYLVCKDICIPEQFDFALDIMVGDPVLDNRWNANINRAIASAPAPVDWPASARFEDGQIKVDVLSGALIENAYFFPNDPGITEHSVAQDNRSAERGAALSFAKSFASTEGLQGPVQGVLGFDRIENGKVVPDGVILSVSPGDRLDIGAISAASSAPSGVAPSLAGGKAMSLWAAIVGGLLGGIILNIMPCVFPVISMKALSFANHAHDDRAAIRREGWMYTFGVIACFAILVAVLAALKAGGAQIGWGFQLQSPWVVGLVTLLLFAIGLNLIGAFDIGGGFQNMGSGLTAKGGNSGAFFTGVLAVIVATPCSAPFMAGAVGFALAQSFAVMAAVFFALAVGFALPFLLLAHAPGLLAKLPKPGPWMVRFKEFLAFPMFAAAIYMLWVGSVQTGANGAAMLLLAMLLLGFAVWLFKRKTLGKAIGAAALVGALAIPFTLTTQTASAASVSYDDLQTYEWSPETVQQLQEDGRAVFVDFTAAWCVTCKVNERLVLKTDKVITAFNDTNTAFVIADWTNKNDAIAQELEKYGRAGVPLYLYFPPKSSPDYNSERGQVLPQTLRVNMIVSLLEGE